MDFKSSQEDFKNEISELVTHIKHLSENWEINLTVILDRYLKLVHSLSKDTLVSLDFSVAAMLLQMSGTVYGKKVDYVWKQLIHLQELLTSSINIERNAEEEVDVPAKSKKRVSRISKQTYDSTEFEELKVKTSMNVEQKKSRGSSSKPHKLSYDFLSKFPTINTPVFSNLTLLDLAGERIGESKDFRVNFHLDHHCRLENPLERIEPGDVDLGNQLPLCESSEGPVFDAILSTEFMTGFDQMESEDHLEDPLLKQATLPQPDQAMLPLDVNPPSPVGSERCVGQEGREGEGREVLASSLSNYSGSEWPISPPGEELPKKSVNKKKSCVKKKLSKRDRLSTSDWDPLGDRILGCLKGLRLTMLPELTVQKLEYQRLLQRMSNPAIQNFQGDIQAFLSELAREDEEDFTGFLNPPLESSELGVDDGFGPSLLEDYVDHDMEDNNNCFSEELGAHSPGSTDLPLSQDYQPLSGKEAFTRANQQINQLLDDPNEQAKRREEMYQRVEKWEQYVTPLLIRAHTRDNFNIDEFESRVLAAFPAPLVNSKLTFKHLMVTRPSEDVSRYFLACLMLAKAGNIEITTSGEGEQSMDTVELTLLSLTRRQDQMEEDCSKMTASTSGGHRGKKKQHPKVACRKMDYQRNRVSRGEGSPAVEQEPSVATRTCNPSVSTRTHEPSVSTRTHEPSVSTRTHEPSVSTRTHEPSVSTRTHEPSVTTRTCNPSVSTRTHEPSVSTRTHDPSVSTRTHEPNVSTRTHEPSVSTRTHDPSVSTRTRDPSVSTRTHDPSVSTRTHDPSVSTRTRDPSVSTRTHEPIVSTRTHEPIVSTRTHEPSVSTRTHDPSVSTRTHDPSVSTRTPDPSVSTRTSEPSVSTRTSEPSVTRTRKHRPTLELSSRINGFNPNSTSTPLPVKSPLFDKTRHANHLEPGENNLSVLKTSRPKSVSLSCSGTGGHSLDPESSSSSSDSSYSIPKRKKKKKKKSMD